MTRCKAILLVVPLVGTACIGKRSADAQTAAKTKTTPAPATAEAQPKVEAPPAKEEATPTPLAADPTPKINDRSRFQSLRPEAATMKTGDLVFIQSAARYATALGSAMPGTMNHVGVVFVTADGPQVVSAGNKLDQSSYDRFLRTNGSKGRIVIKRLADADRLLTDERMLPLKQFSFTSRGREFDYGFDWGDSTLYSSEYVYKAFDKGPGVQLGKKQTLASLGLDAAMAKQIGDKYGTALSVDTEVVTPTSIFEDERLITVFDSAS